MLKGATAVALGIDYLVLNGTDIGDRRECDFFG